MVPPVGGFGNQGRYDMKITSQQCCGNDVKITLLNQEKDIMENVKTKITLEHTLTGANTKQTELTHSAPDVMDMLENVAGTVATTPFSPSIVQNMALQAIALNQGERMICLSCFFSVEASTLRGTSGEWYCGIVDSRRYPTSSRLSLSQQPSPTLNASFYCSRPTCPDHRCPLTQYTSAPACTTANATSSSGNSGARRSISPYRRARESTTAALEPFSCKEGYSTSNHQRQRQRLLQDASTNSVASSTAAVAAANPCCALQERRRTPSAHTQSDENHTCCDRSPHFSASITTCRAPSNLSAASWQSPTGSRVRSRSYTKRGSRLISPLQALLHGLLLLLLSPSGVQQNYNSLHPACNMADLCSADPWRSMADTDGSSWRYIVGGLPGLVTVTAEPLHHSRSYKDEYGLEPPRRVFGVKTFQQGLEYLVKYGWVNCTLSYSSYQNAYSDFLLKSNPDSSAQEGVSSKPLCTEDETSKGYMAMQQYYKLPETGTLDDNTLRLMNSKRCGNRDSGGEESGNDVTPSPDAVSSTAASPTGRGRRRRRRAALAEIERRKSEEVRERHAREWTAAHGSVILGKILTPTKISPAASVVRRQQILNSYTEEFRRQDFLKAAMNRKRKQHHINHNLPTKSADVILSAARDKVGPDGDLYEREVKHRKKRSAMILLKRGQPEVFKKARDECVTWRIPDICFSRRIPATDQRAIVKLAFRMWSEVIPLCFSEQTSGPIRSVDIQICFAKDTHLNCDIPFDGNGGELAHSWKLGNIHFDDAENYRPQGNGGINLLKVAVHEIGHVLGLNHTQRDYSVMYSIYIGLPTQTDFELGWEDRKEVQKYYGVCKGRFDTVFDWIRLSVTQGLIYNTYFFRKGHYWMYENRYNRTRYGDPLQIKHEWKGIPDNVDAYTQVILWDPIAYRWDINTYFFKGQVFYMFNSTTDRVQERSLIGDYFGPMNDSSDSIPDNIDSVFFDIHSRKIQFFKGPWVYIYDPASGRNSCCDHKVKFTDIYPTPEGMELKGNIDAVYFSHTLRKQYFFQDEKVWINEKPNKNAPNKLVYQKEWYGIWFDICEVGVAPAAKPLTLAMDTPSPH